MNQARTTRTTRTDANGQYGFEGLAAGDGYQVCLDLPAGMAGSNGSRSLARGQQDTSAEDPNNYLDDDDNAKMVAGMQCSGFIILNDRLASNQRVDFGFYTPSP